MELTIQNNFNAFKAQFKEDTGLEWKSNIDAYLVYYQARCADRQSQILAGIFAQNGIQIKELQNIIAALNKK